MNYHRENYCAGYPSPHKGDLSVTIINHRRPVNNDPIISSKSKCNWCLKYYENSDPYFKNGSFHCTQKGCNTIYCHYCNPYFSTPKNMKCYTCNIKSKQSLIKKAISKSLDLSKKLNINNNHKLYKLIAEYGRGYVVNCCNQECKDEIFIEDHWELAQYQLCHFHLHPFYQVINGGATYYVYRCRYNDGSLKTVNVNGVEYRIFCANCVNTISRFNWKRCSVCYTRDIVMEEATKEPDHYLPTDIKYICCKHPFCELCKNRSSKVHKCYYCKKKYCEYCGIKDLKLCKNCVVLDEYQWIYDGVLRGLQHSKICVGNDIAGIIAEYAMGYILNCCVQDCYDEINVKNLWDLWKIRKSPDDDDEYYWYEITKNQYEDEIYNVYHMRIRIFCQYCNNNVLKVCSDDSYFSDNPKCHNRDVWKQCKNHPYCIECGKWDNDIIEWGYYDCCNDLALCPWCDEKEVNGYCFDCYQHHCDEYHNGLDQRQELLGVDVRGDYDDQDIYIKTCKPYRLYGKSK